MHRFGKKAQREILIKQLKKSKVGREKRDVLTEFWDAIYWKVPFQMYGFPASAFFKAFKRQAKYVQGLNMTDFSSNVSIRGHDDGFFVAIWGDPAMHFAMVRVKGGGADLRIRPCFYNWGALVKVSYNENVLSDEIISTLIDRAGKLTGVGDWRPEKDGIYGTFQVEQCFEIGDEDVRKLEENLLAERLAEHPVITPAEVPEPVKLKAVSANLTPAETRELVGPELEEIVEVWEELVAA